MPVQNGTAAVTALCRNSSLMCCAAVDAFQPVVPEGLVWLLPWFLPSCPWGKAVVFLPQEGTWAPQMLLQTSLPYSLTFSMLSTGTALRRGLSGNGTCGMQGWEGRARKGKRSEEKECPLPEPGISFYLVHPTVKITHFYVGGICWDVEGKMDPLYQKPQYPGTLFLWIELTLPVECQLKC